VRSVGLKAIPWTGLGRFPGQDCSHLRVGPLQRAVRGAHDKSADRCEGWLYGLEGGAGPARADAANLTPVASTAHRTRLSAILKLRINTLLIYFTVRRARVTSVSIYNHITKTSL
jgi:hypothetical protein